MNRHAILNLSSLPSPSLSIQRIDEIDFLYTLRCSYNYISDYRKGQFIGSLPREEASDNRHLTQINCRGDVLYNVRNALTSSLLLLLFSRLSHHLVTRTPVHIISRCMLPFFNPLHCWCSRQGAPELLITYGVLATTSFPRRTY